MMIRHSVPPEMSSGRLDAYLNRLTPAQLDRLAAASPEEAARLIFRGREDGGLGFFWFAAIAMVAQGAMAAKAAKKKKAAAAAAKKADEAEAKKQKAELAKASKSMSEIDRLSAATGGGSGLSPWLWGGLGLAALGGGAYFLIRRARK